MHSAIEKMITASSALPAELKQIFDLYFGQGKSEQEVCSIAGISINEFSEKKKSIARSLRSAAT